MIMIIIRNLGAVRDALQSRARRANSIISITIATTTTTTTTSIITLLLLPYYRYYHLYCCYYYDI